MRRKNHPKSSTAKTGPAPVVRAPSRAAIKDLTRIQLFVRAGGRCEFPGCNEYLLEHPLTITPGNLAQMAHVVAYSRGGPRADGAFPREYVNDLSNLMLLCPRCHKEVDDHPDTYSVGRLRKAKVEHEDRIQHVTGFSADLKTDVVRFTAKIGGRTVRVPFDQIAKAVEPHYPRDRKGTVIDLTDLDDRDEGFLKLASQRITNTITKLTERNLDGDDVQRIAVFALGPIPLLIHLGRELSDKVNVHLFQRHRDTEDWCWKSSGTPVSYIFRRLREGTDKKSVALCLAFSGPIDLNTLPANIDARFSIYEITLAGQTPTPTFLRLAADLDEFARIYRTALSEIALTHGAIEHLHLFPAIPAPLAVHCGRALLPKIDPTLLVYDADKANGGFTLITKVN